MDLIWGISNFERNYYSVGVLASSVEIVSAILEKRCCFGGETSFIYGGRGDWMKYLNLEKRRMQEGCHRVGVLCFDS